MINKIRLNHTVWYSYAKKIIRINISDLLPTPISSYSYTISGQIEYPGLVKVHTIDKNVEPYGDFEPDPLTYMPINPLDSHSDEKPDKWNSRVDIEYTTQKSFDIILHPHEKFDADGELKVTIGYWLYNGTEDGYTEDLGSFMNTKHELHVIIPFRSHNNEAKNIPQILSQTNKYTNVEIRNDRSNTIGASDEPVIYECDLVNLDVTDERPTYGDVLDMINIEGRKEVTLTLEGDTLRIIVGDRASEVNLAKYRDENTNNTLNVEDLKRDILSIVDGKLPNVETIKQEILADVNPRILDKETLKNEILAAVPTPSATPYELTPMKMTKALTTNTSETEQLIDFINDNISKNGNLVFNKLDDHYEIVYRYNNQYGDLMSYTDTFVPIINIPFTKLRENPSGSSSIDVDSLKNKVINNFGYKEMNLILTSFSNPEDYTYAQDIITALLNNYFKSDEYYTQHPEELENGFGNKLINHTTNILDKITKDAADREKAGKLFQKLLDAETLNVVEKTDGYELSYTGDVNKVLVKIPKQAITVSQEVLTTAITENVVTETIKPTLDKSYYSKQEVDQLIQQLEHKLMSEDHGEEHPQQ